MCKRKTLYPLLLALFLCLTGCSISTATNDSSDKTPPPGVTHEHSSQDKNTPSTTEGHATSIDLSAVPAYSGEPYIVINDNIPNFTESDLTTESFETYSDLDSLGRCGTAFACIGKDLMPTEEREGIGQIKPSGWQTAKYDIIDGKYLYNRCHLIGFQLTAENANKNNLITGTRYLNVEAMLPFENMVADYVKETNNHVLYRVTPIFEGDNLVASGVHMEAKSVEDDGEGVLFNVYCYNVQPNIEIDYATGNSWSNKQTADQQEPASSPDNSSTTYILNTNSHRFHLPSCSSIKEMDDSNKKEVTGTRDEVIAMGYSPCGRCKP